jgi:RNA polymerase sigma factor (sigma-70 family)
MGARNFYIRHLTNRVPQGEHMPVSIDAGAGTATRTAGSRESVPTTASANDTALIEARLVQCVCRMAAGDQAALAELYDSTVGRVYAVAMRFVKNEQTAEEVVSDVYFESWREAGRYDRRRGRVVTWLLVRCRSRSLDALRRRDIALSAADTDQIPAESMEQSSASDPIETTERVCAVRRALTAMPAAQRLVVSLSFYGGLSHSQIAAREHMPLGTVKTHMRSALQRLRASLRELG